MATATATAAETSTATTTSTSTRVLQQQVGERSPDSVYNFKAPESPGPAYEFQRTKEGRKEPAATKGVTASTTATTTATATATLEKQEQKQQLPEQQQQIQQALATHTMEAVGHFDDDHTYDDNDDDGSESYLAIRSSTRRLGDAEDEPSVYTAFQNNNDINNSILQNPAPDATDTVHEMHLALLYLLSHPEEFHRALELSRGNLANVTTLADWNAEYHYSTTNLDTESVVTSAVGASTITSNHPLPVTTTTTTSSPVCGLTSLPTPPSPSSFHDHLHTTDCNNTSSSSGSSSSNTPLPFVVFADDAEVVLPQAHTVSQLFGIETREGIELEAAAGIPAISQLFLRWLALMPGGDHLNLIDPPGLTVMRIAGGRYRVTAAHRVVWTWMNALFWEPQDPLLPPQQPQSQLLSPAEMNNYYLQPGDLVTMTIVDVFETDSQGKLLSYCPTFDNRQVLKTHPTAETLRKSHHKLVEACKMARNSKLTRLLLSKAKYVAQSVGAQARKHISLPATNNNTNAIMTPTTTTTATTTLGGDRQGRSHHYHYPVTQIYELALDLPEDQERHEV